MSSQKHTWGSLISLRSALLVAGLVASSASHATFIFDGPDDTGGMYTSFYKSESYFAAVNADGGFTSDMAEGRITSSQFAPIPLNVNGNLTVNGANIQGTASTSPGGFFTARNSSSVNVSNTADTNGYTALGGYGSRTSVRFFSAQALADRAVFHWNVSGVNSPNSLATCNPAIDLFSNCATSRLDFLATTNTSLTFYDVFNPAYGALKEYGPGSFSYNIGGMPLDQMISLIFWSSAYVYLDDSQTTAGGTFNAFANFSNTYDLVDIDLFDSENNLITDWTMTDLTTQRVVFNQDGVVQEEDVPVPATLALLGLGLTALGISRRKRA